MGLVIWALPLSGGADTSFGEAGDYLRYGAGARSLGMGGAFTAVADDVSADYWNPAALAYLDEYQFQTMYAPFGMGSNLYYMGFGAPMGTRLGTLGLSALSLRSDGFQRRDELNFRTGGNGDVSHNAVSLSYGRSFMDLWSLGARLRFLQQNILSDSGSAMGVDLSAYSRPWNGISAGATFNNLNKPSITVGNDADEFRAHTRLGLAYRAPRDLFILSFDANKTEQQSVYFVSGLEYNPVPLLSLRTGWDQNKDVTVGMGVTLRNLRFDYAFVNQEALGATNQVSLTFRWGNIYRAKITPVGLAPNSDSIYIEGLRNEVRFAVDVPKLKIAHWTLMVSDEEGKVVRSMSEHYHPGSALLWDMTDENGRPVKRGLYRYRFAIEYKSGKVWEERGKFRLDYKTNIVPEVELRMRVPGGLEGADPAPQFAPITPPVPTPEPVPTLDSAGTVTPN
ncbi:MAG: PorV/PorQ family protein [Elusimicrobia bacterium]|jgi:hypothetical protein|nr:PorV/PorQ family protein [Elusimicrobiota bacterium]